MNQKEKKRKKNPKRYQDFELRAWLENFHPFEAELHHKRNQNQSQIGYTVIMKKKKIMWLSG